jgi:predicted ATP-grasp superfamily ATP-dependent carboligase
MAKPRLRIIREKDIPGAVLVYAFEGWTDSGLAASLALDHLEKQAGAEVFAEFEPDELFDYRSRRPLFRVSNGVSQGLEWPLIRFSTGSIENVRFAILQGGEPDLNWQGFAAAVADFAKDHSLAFAIGMGSIPAPVPHTRDVPIIATSPDPTLVERVGALEGTAQVPAGVQLAIEQAVFDCGIPSMSIWARVPHYIAAMAWPPAAVSLLQTLEHLLGLTIDLADLAAASVDARAKIDQAVRQNREAAEYVAQLERLMGTEESSAERLSQEFGEVTGEQIASEIEQFLASHASKEGRSDGDRRPGGGFGAGTFGEASGGPENFRAAGSTPEESEGQGWTGSGSESTEEDP